MQRTERDGTSGSRPSMKRRRPTSHGALTPRTLVGGLSVGIALATLVLLLAQESPVPIALASGVACLVTLAWGWLAVEVLRQRRLDISLWTGKRLSRAMTTALVVVPLMLLTARELGWLSANLYHLRSETSRHATFSGGKPRSSLFRLRNGGASIPEAFGKGFYAALGLSAPAREVADSIVVRVDDLPYEACMTPFIKTFAIRAEASWLAGSKSVHLRGRIVGPVSFSACMELLGAAVGTALAEPG
jgi:hypothetical protein